MKLWIKSFKFKQMKMIFRFPTLEPLWSRNYSIWLKIQMKSKKIRKDLFIFGNSIELFQTQIWSSLKILRSHLSNRTRRRMIMTRNQKIKRKKMEVKILLKRFQSSKFLKRVRTLIKVASSKSKKQLRNKLMKNPSKKIRSQF